MDKYIGKRLDGRYEIRELIGVGGMANVYKAFDIADNRWVAVKILRDEFMGNEEFLRRFRNESKAVATLSHPNIVKVYDVSFSQRMHSIVMEYIDGITLKDFIDRQGRLGWKETVHFTVQILRGLQHAHDNGIVHRDIKPQNIMLLSDGTIKVTDFGIARFARSNTRTITDRAIGSVHYISPEQAQGGVTDEKTDLYSVGVMMYEMLTGRLPFDADTPVSVALKQIQLEPARPSTLNPDIPEGLEAITMRAMLKDPARRYQSAAEMLRDIDEFKRNPSISFAYKYLGNSIQPIPAAGEEGQENAKRRGKKREKEKTRIPEEPAAGFSEDLEEEEEERPRIPFLSVLTGITVAFVLVSGIFVGTMFYFNNPFQTVDSIEVPNLVGKKFSTVKYDNTYIENDIRIVQTVEFNNDYEEDIIFEQNPRAGRGMKKGSTIQVTVSAGAQRVTLIDLTGMESNEAYEILEKNGLKNYEEMRIYDDNIAEGYVVKTDPPANEQVDSDTAVQVFVSMGRENKLIQVPDITGMKLNDAKRFLKNLSISIGRVTTVESDLERGTIVAQMPGTDSEVAQGSSIDVDVSGGAEENKRLAITVTLPKLRDLLIVEAWLDGQLAHEARLTPGSDPDSVEWRKIYEGYGEMTLQIRINGMLYQEYLVNFDDESHAKIVDNKQLFQDGLPESVPEREPEEEPDDEDDWAPPEIENDRIARPD
ncbi:MAG: Stk1 family PASTA domain-containing Ser/Thr kinase [Provencibacterium sp.]|jgi:serine/threonine protein kinase|nr:Stk1 family PASTA domain-containing Ser/Thr kinase [Provencibacterium sp.]